MRSICAVLDLRVSHVRTQNGDREVDLIVERPDGRVLALEVKLASTVEGADVRIWFGWRIAPVTAWLMPRS